jgi:hypothetical protein
MKFNSNSTGVKFGIYLGIFLLLFNLIFLYTSIPVSSPLAWFFYLSYPITIYLAFRKINRLTDEKMPGFGQLFIAGLLLSLVATGIYAVYVFVEAAYIDDKFLLLAKENVKEQLAKSKLNEAEIQSKLERVTPMLFAVSVFIRLFLTGLVSSVILAFIFTKLVIKRKIMKPREDDSISTI